MFFSDKVFLVAIDFDWSYSLKEWHEHKILSLWPQKYFWFWIFAVILSLIIKSINKFRIIIWLNLRVGIDDAFWIAEGEKDIWSTFSLRDNCLLLPLRLKEANKSIDSLFKLYSCILIEGLLKFACIFAVKLGNPALSWQHSNFYDLALFLFL